MNANKQDAGGLLPCPFCGDNNLGHKADCYLALCLLPDIPPPAVMEAAWNRRAELCRAAPAGGVRVDGEMFICYLIDKCERETISEESLHEWLADFLKNPRYHKPVSAPAGSGEVHPIPQELFDRAHRLRELAAANRLNECLPTIETMCGKNAGDAIRDAAALLRKLQQGAE